MSDFKKTFENPARWFLPQPMTAQMIAMLIMASRGRPAMVHSFPDAGLHIAAYALLAVLSRIAWQGFAPAASHRFLARAAVCTAILYGAVDEGIQSLSPARAGQIEDFIADIAGAIIGLLLIQAFERIKRTHRRRAHE